MTLYYIQYDALIHMRGALLIYNRRSYSIQKEALLYIAGGSIIYNRRLHSINKNRRPYCIE